MKTPRQPARGPAMNCPHCGAKAIARSSERITDITREIRFLCEEMECGFGFKALLTVTHTVRPSARPRPGLHIPASPRCASANDDVPVPANDERPPAAADSAPLTG